MFQAILANAQRRYAGHKIAKNLVGLATVGTENVEHRLHRNTAVEKLHVGQNQTFLKEFGGIGRQRARHHASQVHPMALVRHPCHQPAVVENRQSKCYVVDMAYAARVGIVADEQIAGFETRCGVLAENIFDGGVQHAHKAGNAGAGAGQIPLCIRDRDAEIKHLVDHRAHGGARHGSEHLVGNRGEGSLNDLYGKRIDVTRCLR